MRITRLFRRPITPISLGLGLVWVLWSAFTSEDPAARVDASRTDGGPTSLASEDFFQGVAHVIDGDTLVVDNVRVRLHGIDAFEANQSCRIAGERTYACGAMATQYLRDLIGDEAVLCQTLDIDPYQRAVAVCSTPKVADLNAAMVHAGFALAYRRFSDDYVVVEDGARAAKVGAWQGFFMEPWNARY